MSKIITFLKWLWQYIHLFFAKSNDSMKVLYSGKPYGDMLDIQAQVQKCMGIVSDDQPRIVIVDRPFLANTAEGVIMANGAYSPGFWKTITMYDKSLIDSKGSLYAHELTHFYGDHGQDNKCGQIKKEGFRL